MTGLVAIHQPNFFPWLGFFDKMARCDTFVILDDVQFPKGDGNYTNRVRVMSGGEARWFTVPVDRSYDGVRDIREIRMRDVGRWQDKFIRTLQVNYGKSGFFHEVMEWMETFVRTDDNRIGHMNESVTRDLHGRFGLSCHVVRSSDLQVDGSSTERLVALVKAADGDAYLAGGGASGYQDDALFADAGIDVKMQDFTHPTYDQPQVEVFRPGLSVLDALFNLGFDGTGQLLRGPAA